MRQEEEMQQCSLVRFCDKRPNEAYDYGAEAVRPGTTKVWNTLNADERSNGACWYIRLARNGSDWYMRSCAMLELSVC
ncbi:MAG: hypothetical protein KF874_14590 [Rhizobiaceae bacterium]|nr:hypothetical protein [Rhizobiaceae bacterium]